MIKQLSVFVENETGSLMKVTSALTKAHVNIRAVASFDTPEFGILRMVVDQPQIAKDYLTSQGFVVRIHEVMGVELIDKKGNLNDMLSILAKGNININYIYSFVIRKNEAPVMVFSTDDFQKAAEILCQANVKIVDEIKTE
ncbi:MAG: amino acid-binding protein [Lachnospiraceae bacterium]